MKEKKNKWIKEIDPEILSKFKNYFSNETSLNELRKDAREYSGSYNIIYDSNFKTVIEDGKSTIKYMYYTNPNNLTDFSYLHWSGIINKIRVDGSCTISSSSLLPNEVEEIIKSKIEFEYYKRKEELFNIFNISEN